jgi:hypothetical protein
MSAILGTGFKHHGQHDPTRCYACKLHSLTFNSGQPKTHVKRGDHWDGNPVVDRIMDFKAGQAREEAQWAARDAQQARELANYHADQGVPE